MEKILDKQISLVIKLEHDELSEYQKLSRETLKEMEKTKTEIKIEERIRLNLTFVHYKLKQIHGHIQEILKLSRSKESIHVELEINHIVKLILKEVLEIEKDFLPIIKKNIAFLIKGESKFYAHQIQKEFLGYKHIVDKLKHTFRLSSYSLVQLDSMRRTKVGKIKTHLR